MERPWEGGKKVSINGLGHIAHVVRVFTLAQKVPVRSFLQKEA